MKRSIVSFILGVILTLSVVFAINSSLPAKAEPTPQIVYRDKIITKEVIKEVEKFTDLETVAKNVKNSAVMIYAYLPNGTTSQGSGVVVGDGSYIITAKHLIEQADTIDVFVDDSAHGVPGTVYYTDPKLDIAIIKADTGLPSVNLGDSDNLREGEKLVSITSPQGAKNVVEECTFAGKLETNTVVWLNISDTITVGGSSGGAILNYGSRIIGMIFGGEEGVSQAIPVNNLKPILSKLK